MTCDGHRRERASTVVDAARDPATPSKDGIARALHVVVGGGHSVGTRRAADAPRAADIETLSPRRLESARGARRDGRDARRGARVAGGRWLHARQRVSRETSAELSSFFLRCRSEVFPDAPISAVEPTENSRMLRWQGESSCSFRAFRKRAVVFALDFLFSCANTRTIERFVKRTKIPKLEPIRSRLPSFPDPTRREFRLSHRIRRVVRQPLPTHLSILDEFFSVRVFAKWDLRPRVRLGRHTRTHLTSASHTRLRNGCRYHVYGRCHARPRRREQVRLQGHPRLRGRAQEGGWRPRHPPGTNTGDAPARTEPGRRTPPARRSRERARLPTRASIETRARPRRRRRVDPAHARRHRIARRLEKREPSHRSRVQRVSRAGEDARIAPRASRGDREIPSAHAATRAAPSRRAPRASCRPRARDPAHVRARRALPARLDRLFIHSLPFGARGGTRTRRAEPGFPESRASSAKKRKNVSSLFERRGCFFFREDGARPRFEPGSLNPV